MRIMMGIKRKLILIGICFGIILIIFTVNVIQKMKVDKDITSKDSEIDNVITRAQAYRLFSYLEYNKEKREALKSGITYSDKSMSGWYDTYVNAAWNMGLIGSDITDDPNGSLTYGSCKELVDKLIIKNPSFQAAYDKLTFDFAKADDYMIIPDFIELFEELRACLPEGDNISEEKSLLVLGRDVTEDGRDRMVTDVGKYYYLDAQNYIEYFDLTSDEITPAAENNTKADEWSKSSRDFIDDFMDKGIKVLVCDDEIIYITGIFTDEIVLHNVWIKSGEGTTVDTFVNGLNKGFQAKLKLSNKIEKVIGDITIKNQKITQISVKPDMIHGKVLRTNDNFIEIEGYGEVPLDKDMKIYKLYGSLSLEPTSSILVGYENTDFIVSEGKISAAIITESIKAENIRVLIQTTDYKSIFHKKVEFTATSEFIVSSDESDKVYKAGDIVTIELDDELLKGQRITVKPITDDTKIQLLSIERKCGNPKFRGDIEISKGEEGLLVVNELPLEEYLYAVIPSEMPTSYGEEALKAQAVCARSYAYKHLMANSLSGYGAHVNDSASYQVYNNLAENEDSILAVKDTYGKVIKYDGDVINAYYFSTSCGHTAGSASVWGNNIDFPYLDGKLLIDNNGDNEANLDLYGDLSSEESFRSFINDQALITYDSSFNWYRWKASMNIGNIKKVVDANLASRYNANPELILTMTTPEKDGQEAVYESIPVDTIGDILDIKITKRDRSGIVTELILEGSDRTIKAMKEYNIRALLAPLYDKLVRLDGSEVLDLQVLPSAFFIIDKEVADGKLTGITVSGGGYGHGVGMSQNGVKALADSGKSYEDILSYFYKGIELGFIYE
jgi:stage II sporulation protein D